MLILPLFILQKPAAPSTSPISEALSAAVDVLTHRPPAAVSMVNRISTNGQATEVKSTVTKFPGGGFYCHVAQAPTPATMPFDLQAWVSHGQAFFADNYHHTALSLAGGKKIVLPATMNSFFQSVLAPYDPHWYEQKSQLFSHLKNWKRSATAEHITWKAGKPGNLVVFVFQKSPLRLIEYRVVSAAGSIDNQWQYMSTRSIPPIPQGYRPSQAISIAAAQRPQYGTGEIQVIANKSLAAYDQLGDLHVRVQAPRGMIEIWRWQNIIRQRDAVCDWQWDGTTLVLRKSKTFKFITTPATLMALPGILQKYGERMEPLTTSLADETNFFEKSAPADENGSIVGNIGSGSDSREILQFKNAENKVSVTILSNGLIDSVATTLFSKTGKDLLNSVWHYSYLSPNVTKADVEIDNVWKR